MAVKNLVGQVFGKWTVLSHAGSAKNGQSQWLCRCECGNEKVVSRSNLVSGKSKQCIDCGGGRGKKKDLTGLKFGDWTVEEFAGAEKAPGGTVHFYWCRCVCGARKRVRAGNLRSGQSLRCRSCSNSGPDNPRHEHGHTVDSPSRTYITWASMKARCNDPNHTVYKYYGGDGVKVCQGWHSFANFLQSMGERPEGLTIDRSNKDESTKHYSCGHCDECVANGWVFHCTWATEQEQKINRTFRKRSG